MSSFTCVPGRPTPKKHVLTSTFRYSGHHYQIRQNLFDLLANFIPISARTNTATYHELEVQSIKYAVGMSRTHLLTIGNVNNLNVGVITTY